MQEEERRLGTTAGRVQFKALPSTSKSQFFRKAIIKPTGEEFKFNFQIDQLSLNDKAPEAAAESGKEEPAAVSEPVKPAVNLVKIQPSDNSFRFNFQAE